MEVGKREGNTKLTLPPHINNGKRSPKLPINKPSHQAPKENLNYTVMIPTC
jgi:hypothetical protein